MTTITVTEDKGEYVVRLKSSDSDMFRALIEELKDRVSSFDRIFDRDAKVWRVFNWPALESWLSYARLCGAQVQFVGQQQEQQRQEQHRQTSNPPPRRPGRLTQDEALATLYLRSGAPAELVKAAHKALAMIYHPDRPGGDLRKMQEINAAYDFLKVTI